MTIKVSAAMFKAVHRAVCSDAYRPYLHGVRIEPHEDGGAILVATNGHYMIVAHDKDADCDDQATVGLPKFALALLSKDKETRLETDKCTLVVNVEDTTATIVHEISKRSGGTEQTAVATAHRVIVGGQFPDWRNVTPKGELIGTGVSCFNPKYLSVLGSAGFDLSRSGQTPAQYMLKQRESSDGDPVAVRWDGINHAFAVLMPMRGDPVARYPTFFSPPASHAKLEAAE